MATNADPSGRETRAKDGRFLPGNGGRPSGTRNRFQADFIKALAKSFDEHGSATIEIVRKEKPVEYLKICAGVLPKEFVLTDDTLSDMTNEELSEALATVRRLKVVGGTDAA